MADAALRFHHLVVFCRDPAATRAFLVRAGYRHLRGYGGMEWVALGPGEIMLHPASEAPPRGGTIVHAAVPDVDAHFARAVDARLEPVDMQAGGARLEAPVTRPWGDREFDLVGPDGETWSFTEATS